MGASSAAFHNEEAGSLPWREGRLYVRSFPLRAVLPPAPPAMSGLKFNLPQTWAVARRGRGGPPSGARTRRWAGRLDGDAHDLCRPVLHGAHAKGARLGRGSAPRRDAPEAFTALRGDFP